MRIGIRLQGLPIVHSLVPFHAGGREWAAFDIGNGFLVHRHQARTGTGFDGHIANRHTAFHAQSADGRSCKFDGVARSARCADLANDGQHDVFGGDAFGQHTIDLHQHVFGFFGQQGLRGHDVLNLRGANTVRQCAKSAMGRGV